MIRMLDHTADVGFELEAPTLEALFDEECVELLGCASAINTTVLERRR